MNTSSRHSTVSVGNRAERSAATYLQQQGHEIIDMNYRRKHCEIDIVAREGDQVVFVEVKYRGSPDQGNGLDYVTALKLRHMERAAVTWVEENRWRGPYNLAAIEVGGPYFEVLEYLNPVF